MHAADTLHEPLARQGPFQTGLGRKLVEAAALLKSGALQKGDVKRKAVSRTVREQYDGIKRLVNNLEESGLKRPQAFEETRRWFNCLINSPPVSESAQSRWHPGQFPKWLHESAMDHFLSVAMNLDPNRREPWARVLVILGLCAAEKGTF